AVPATFDLRSGKLKSFALPARSRQPGGWFAAISKEKRRGIEFDSEINRDQHEDRVYTGDGVPGVRSTVTFGARSYDFRDGWPGVEGEIHSMLAADDKLFVVTRDGAIWCLGPGAAERVAHDSRPRDLDPPDDDRSLASRILRATGMRHGYALVWGITDGRLVEELALRTDLAIIGVDPDRTRIDRLRRRFDEAGIYGQRVSLHAGGPSALGFPPYIASLIVSEDIGRAGIDTDASFLERLYSALRPYGGVACLVDAGSAAELRAIATRLALPQLEIESPDGLVLLRRAGALPGATDYLGGWRESPDERVRAPVGVLWFDDTLGHFKRSPQPVFVGGLMISHPKDWRSGEKPPYRLTPAIYSDVYTGRVLSPGEATAVAGTLPREDLSQTQPNQYRPPTQKDDWNPEPPRPGRRINPLTGLAEARAFPKSYGCDGGVDYGYIYTMRSGTPAYYDKRSESGTIHISGPRSGCTNSLIPANGLLNVPYFYEGCTCSYPLPVGLALAPMPPEHEQWASWGPGDEAPGGSGGSTPIQRVGINFGAPGDRVAGGTLWLDVPSVGGPSPEIRVETEPASPELFYRHSLWIEGGQGWPWVAASGARGLSGVRLEGLTPGRFTVRLVFCEPDQARPGDRVFDVSIQGQRVLDGFDIAREAGGRMRSVVREFRNIESDGSLAVALSARSGAPVLCGIEIVAGGLPMAAVPVLKEER
ncbi:MAG: malectin, partial [Actinobacteria bacterium]|nr:malectin [Actinomycetota bacterium]